jgi:hypothetical protein
MNEGTAESVSVADDKPSLLYHYTTQAGLLGIIGKKTLWASSILHLNDAGEFRYALNIARTIASEERAVGRNMTDFENTLALMRNVLNVYVCSFSTEKDQLSQWRAYCRDGSGFSIGFDQTKLRELARGQDFTLDECTYDSNEHEVSIRALFNTILERGMENFRKPQPKFLAGFMTVAPRMKHPSFAEEREWRLINRRLTANLRNTEILYRPGKSFFVPYNEFYLGDNLDSLIREIVVGPSPHSELSVRTTMEYLFHRAVKGVKVEESKIPYRSW